MPKSSDKEDPTSRKGNRIKKLDSLRNFIRNMLSKKKACSKKDISKHDADISDSEGGMVSNVDSFSMKTAEDVMIPRSDIISVSDQVTLEELSKLIIKNSHTRTLIYKESLDNIIGFVHIKDLFNVISLSKKFVLKTLIRQHIISPHSMKLIDLLAQMQANRTHIAVVVDEYGGTDGIVTIEDIIEEIVGSINDEHDVEPDKDGYEILKPGLLITSARAEIEDLEQVIGVELKSEQDEFDTIGGLVMATVGSVPEEGAVIELGDGVVVEIIESTPRIIKRMKVTYVV